MFSFDRQYFLRGSVQRVALSLLFVIFTGCSTTHVPRPELGLAPGNRLAIANDLRATVATLASDIGERNLYHPTNLERAAQWIERELSVRGYTTIRRTPVEVRGAEFNLPRDATAYNIEAEIPGTSGDVLVIGAHYDSKVSMPGWHAHWPPTPEKPGTPGANDNASGVAGLLALAGQLRDVKPTPTLRFVAFANEEPPFFQTSAMGSFAYAKSLRDAGSSQVRMIALDSIGCYSVRERSKRTGAVSLVGLKDTPDYVALLGNLGSRDWMTAAAEAIARSGPMPVRTLALPRIGKAVAWSDDWSFWEHGYLAFTVTDTAYLRSDSYHELTDTAETLDYEAMAEVVSALGAAIRDLADH